AVMKLLLKEGLLNGDVLTVTGKTMAENLANAPDLAEGQQVVRPMNNPFYSSGPLVILKGNLAPEGAVCKIAGLHVTKHRGPARAFNTEAETLDATMQHQTQHASVFVIRYAGSKGVSGMRYMLA